MVLEANGTLAIPRADEQVGRPLLASLRATPVWTVALRRG